MISGISASLDRAKARGVVMETGKYLCLVLGWLLLAGVSHAKNEDRPVTVVFTGTTAYERLVMVETRQHQRRILTLVPSGSFRAPFAMVIAQKHLNDKNQVHSADSAFVTALAEFSSPRLAVYSDKNPCIRADSPKEDGDVKQPTMSVAGLPYLRAATGTSLKFELLNLKDRSWSNGLKGIAGVDKAALKELAAAGYTILRVDFAPGTTKSKTPELQRAIQIAWESDANKQAAQINGKSELIIERFFLGPETIEQAAAGTAAQFPTGIELPFEAAAVFPSVYRDWQTSQLSKPDPVRGYAGPVNRCDVCYDRPPEAEQLRLAGVFWSAGIAPQSTGAQRVKPSGGEVSETYLSKIIYKKTSGKSLFFETVTEKANVKNSFVEQGSVQKPFLGEIFCPAMDGYQKILAERREKTIAALNELSGWNEKKLSSVSEEAGVVRASWYKSHFQDKQP